MSTTRIVVTDNASPYALRQLLKELVEVVPAVLPSARLELVSHRRLSLPAALAQDLVRHTSPHQAGTSAVVQNLLQAQDEFIIFAADVPPVEARFASLLPLLTRCRPEENLVVTVGAGHDVIRLGPGRRSNEGDVTLFRAVAHLEMEIKSRSSVTVLKVAEVIQLAARIGADSPPAALAEVLGLVSGLDAHERDLFFMGLPQGAPYLARQLGVGTAAGALV